MIFHLVERARLVWDADDRYRPASLAGEGFIHASYGDEVAESARLYFAADADLVVVAIDPDKLDVRLEVATTPRGPMPHIHGPLPRAAVVSVVSLADHTP
ncbi:MAG: DUF952 domain-containing protein [Labilithrix sp.]|nr:DUF952 domain-containing protein [Labilithrix sp.]MCW5816854.1 DUF952 domain-containing protein [Labilithrix sp.]